MSIENKIKQEALGAISRVMRSADWSFNNLVHVSGLRPNFDFRHTDLRGLDLRGADLRGFDFTGADLRECIKNDNTIIDESTILTDADIDWILQERTPIVEKMFQVEKATSPIERRKHLAELVTQYTSDRHVHLYVRNLIESTNSVDALFDYLDVFQAETADDKAAISTNIIRIILKTLRIRKDRRSGSTSLIAYNNLLKRIQESGNSFVRDSYSEFLQNRASAGRVSLNPSKYEVTEDTERLIGAFEYTG